MALFTSNRLLRSRLFSCIAGLSATGGVALGCASHSPVPEVPLPPIAADSGSSRVIAPGIVHHLLYRAEGPWAINVLDVDLAACWTPVVLKRDQVATGRATTTALLQRVQTAGDTIAAINADFFAINGVPAGAHIDDGVVLTGPAVRPAFLVDDAGSIHLRRLRASGQVRARGDSAAISEWNRRPVTQLGVFDERWGASTDSAVSALQIVVGSDGRMVRSVTGAAAAEIPRGGWVLAAGGNVAESTRDWLLALRAGDLVSIRPSLAPLHPREAIGGFPMLVRDSALAPVLDSAHVQGLGRPRHPRTAAGLGRNGNRLILVVVDGRQPEYSVGMSLPELAELMLELGARAAINLDGGGSSTMAVREPEGEVRVLNRPSDPTGERDVANSLAIARNHSCSAGRSR